MCFFFAREKHTEFCVFNLQRASNDLWPPQNILQTSASSQRLFLRSHMPSHRGKMELEAVYFLSRLVGRESRSSSVFRAAQSRFASVAKTKSSASFFVRFRNVTRQIRLVRKRTRQLLGNLGIEELILSQIFPDCKGYFGMWREENQHLIRLCVQMDIKHYHY